MSKLESSNLIQWMDTVATATIYSGVANEEALRAQVAAVVKANSWLAGTLFRSHSCRGQLEIVLPTDEQLEDTDLFETVTKDFPDDITRAQMNSLAVPLIVPVGAKIIGRSNMLFRVTLVRRPDDIVEQAASAKFILIVSMCHVIGDGHTFYRIYGMLSANATPVSLNPVRKEYEKEARQLMGNQEFEYMTSTAAMLKVIISVLVLRTRTIFSKYVNMDAIADCKKQAMTEVQEQEDREVPFVSTNDVLTQRFMKLHGGYGFMLVNLRNRLPHLTDNDAGNYENVLYLTESDMQSPVGVRKTLSRMHSPSFCRMPWTLRICTVVTNWASLYEDLKVEGCCQILHIPIEEEGLMSMGQAIIFKPTVDTTAMYCRSAKQFNVDDLGLFSSDV